MLPVALVNLPCPVARHADLAGASALITSRVKAIPDKARHCSTSADRLTQVAERQWRPVSGLRWLYVVVRAMLLMLAWLRQRKRHRG